MAKPALGRSLGTLMNGSASPPSPETPAQAPASLGPGMKSLLTRPAPGTECETAPAPAKTTPTQPYPTRLSGTVRLGLAAGDVMLVALALVLVFGPTGLSRSLAVPLAALAVALAAWLGCLAVRGEP